MKKLLLILLIGLSFSCNAQNYSQCTWQTIWGLCPGKTVTNQFSPQLAYIDSLLANGGIPVQGIVVGTVLGTFLPSDVGTHDSLSKVLDTLHKGLMAIGGTNSGRPYLQNISSTTTTAATQLTNLVNNETVTTTPAFGLSPVFPANANTVEARSFYDYINGDWFLNEIYRQDSERNDVLINGLFINGFSHPAPYLASIANSTDSIPLCLWDYTNNQPILLGLNDNLTYIGFYSNLMWQQNQVIQSSLNTIVMNTDSLVKWQTAGSITDVGIAPLQSYTVTAGNIIFGGVHVNTPSIMTATDLTGYTNAEKFIIINGGFTTILPQNFKSTAVTHVVTSASIDSLHIFIAHLN